MVSGFASVEVIQLHTIAVNRGKEVSRDLAEGPFFGFLRPCLEALIEALQVVGIVTVDTLTIYKHPSSKPLEQLVK